MFFFLDSTTTFNFFSTLLSLLLGNIHVSQSPYTPLSQLSAEVGVLSGVSYEQHLGSRFTAVGKLGLSTSGEGSPWAYDGVQPAAEVGLRWYFAGVPRVGSNAGSYVALRTYWTYQPWALLDDDAMRHHRTFTYSYSFVWGRNWLISPSWSVKTHVGLGVVGRIVTDEQYQQNVATGPYTAGNEGLFIPADIGISYRF